VAPHSGDLPTIAKRTVTPHTADGKIVALALIVDAINEHGVICHLICFPPHFLSYPRYSMTSVIHGLVCYLKEINDQRYHTTWNHRIAPSGKFERLGKWFLGGLHSAYLRWLEMRTSGLLRNGYSLRNNPEVGSSHLLDDRSQKSHYVGWVIVVLSDP